MNIVNLIAELQDILENHGPIEVLHHDDWAEFVVERVRVEPFNDKADNKQPSHVVLEGDKRMINFETGAIE